MKLAIITATAAVALTGCAAAPAIGPAPAVSTSPPVAADAYTPAPKPTKTVPLIRTIVELCKLSDKDKIADSMKYVKVYDGGETAVVNTRSEYNDIDGVACLLYGIDTPRSIIARMDSTTSLQGQVQAKSDDYSYSWSYHPDNGLNLVIEER